MVISWSEDYQESIVNIVHEVTKCMSLVSKYMYLGR